MNAADHPRTPPSDAPSAFRPWWFADAYRRAAPPPPQVLQGEHSCDVAIVGGGYTGLWTAIMLKQAQPQLRVALIEQDRIGAGASGRNGGCLLTWSAKYLTLRRLFGESEALRLVRASEDAVYAIRDFCRRYAIDAEVRVDGALYTATNLSQRGSMQGVMAALAAKEASSWRTLPIEQVQALAGSTAMLEGVYSPAAGSVHPGLLVLGLARVARELGVAIYEHSPMTALDSPRGQPAQLSTPTGQLQARQVVLATNAWMGRQFREFAGTIAVVSSDMLITEPVPATLAELGLQHGAAVCDSRIFVHYCRSTPDGRLMLGKGGNTFAFGGRMLAEFDQPSRYLPQLQQSLRRFFPALASVPIAASWNGASDRSVTGFPFFGRLSGTDNVFYGFGYSGNGVGPSYLGGQILSSLVLGLDNAWTRSGLTHGPRGYFPPEPFRWVGSQLVRNAIRRKEAMEDREEAPWWLDCQLAKLAQAAGKADKG
ncbi:FAD-dependent oxidoreductase [Chitinibacter sp. ZOR0017]|uniref:FAD-dependent oxidoreductase n=1 Tax=Chitinibacter sp. ZOR0017 TaxID=1339254 RepID=UPI0009DD2E5E|nr:FAD-dependent oxidoreductase [Chitinibacter sp. ZOR0017]